MPDLTLTLELLAFLIVIGGVAGVLAGLLGVGGGIVLVPAFFFTFQMMGYDGPQMMQVCLATSLATIIVTSLRSVISHNRKGAVDWGILRGWAPGIVLGAIVGVLTASALRSATLQMIFGVLALVIGAYMALGKNSWRIADEMPSGGKQYFYSPVVGFLSVLMGIGGGSFGVPLMSLHNVPIHRAVATAAGFGVLIAVPSAVGFLLLTIEPGSRPPLTLGAVNVPGFLVVIAMTLLTAPLGVKLAHAMNPAPLKRLFGAFLILVALNMLRKALMG
ncbi:sulfite exporter TauE/SafE family protein [Salipiger sp. P9]|uniref:sulfite exporter TauE/SafE family protein n=1 Tax=Salipiger pentaromativorans TaxID=2943193 RepID=UPI0021584588|nr:sulfite exporter TauE/SafE family protein [Salipiger pentaromativorans]MCR8546206.1 sulfite exporter TauE/SafE family protein [Salipiger pentaromativorans]